VNLLLVHLDLTPILTFEYLLNLFNIRHLYNVIRIPHLNRNRPCNLFHLPRQIQKAGVQRNRSVNGGIGVGVCEQDCVAATPAEPHGPDFLVRWIGAESREEFLDEGIGNGFAMFDEPRSQRGADGCGISSFFDEGFLGSLLFCRDQFG
jgi:hypothetical protein